MKRTWLTLGALVLCPLLASMAWADEKDMEQRIKQLEQAIEQLKKEQAVPPGHLAGPPDEKGRRLEELGKVTEGPAKVEGTRYGSTMQGSGGLIYARPFVASPSAIIGGYTDLEYKNLARDGDVSEFDAHRLVPFIYGDITDRIKFATEIEFEHFQRGKLQRNRAGNGPEIGVEFMNVDYLITDAVNLRGGIILLPLGKFNLLHDAPLRDLTIRPLVDQLIIPTTLSNPGVGIYGTLYPTQLSKIDYELYLTSGFTGFTDKGPDATSPITGSAGLANASAGGFFQGGVDENNEGKSVVGRLAFSPLLGIEIGGSGFFGSYDPPSKRSLAVWALDWTFQRGPFELIGESAWAYAKDNDKTLGGSPAFETVNGVSTGILQPRRMSGYYIQLNYHFLPEFLVRLAPTHIRPEISTFTAVVRWGQTDLNNDVDGNITVAGQEVATEFQRWTFGLNFRPIEDTVLKTEYELTPVGVKVVDGQTVPGLDHGFVASLATYF